MQFQNAQKMKTSHLAIAILAIAICFVAVEAKPKGHKVAIQSSRDV